MTTENIIEIIGILLSSIIGIISLFLGVSNNRKIKKIQQEGNQNIADSTNCKNSSVNLKANAKNHSTLIQVGGDVKNNGQDDIKSK